MPKTITNATVIGQRVLNATTKLIEVMLPRSPKRRSRGQFVNVQVCKNTAPLLRRPFGVAGVNADNGTFIMIYRIIGEATHILAEVCSGDKLSIVGPLGHGFAMELNVHCWLVVVWDWRRCCIWQKDSVRRTSP